MIVAVVTAKADSRRLPRKNSLPLGGKPLAFWSVEAAQRAGLRTLLATDDKVLAGATGCEVYDHHKGLSHADVIRRTLDSAGAAGSACVLLQPSSPFRFGNIVRRCVRRYRETGQTVVTTNAVHAVYVSDSVRQTPEHLTLWDGCVAVFPPGRVCDWDGVVGVRNLPCNSLQIDTEEDYELACASAEILREPHSVVPPQIAHVLSEAIRLAIGPRVAVVGRFGVIPSDCPVWHVNHCLGYGGGRCDGVAICANKHLRGVGVGAVTRECVRKAKVVLVRDNGELEWLKGALPEMGGKFFRFGAFTPVDDRVTTGAALVDLLNTLGCDVTLVGGFEPRDVREVLIPFHYPGMSREIGVLHMAGARGGQ